MPMVPWDRKARLSGLGTNGWIRAVPLLRCERSLPDLEGQWFSLTSDAQSVRLRPLLDA
jgi:hypothetical protein